MLTRSRALGSSSREACHRYPLPGHALLRLPRPLILATLVPGRFARILARLVGNDLARACLLIGLTPLVLASLVWWGVGFAGWPRGVR